MENSKIEWTDHTFNPWWGCVKVSPGCKFCYAETLDKRWKGGHWGPDSARKTMSEKYWQQPLKWDIDAEISGVKKKVFCASMADVFEDNPLIEASRARLFELIENTPNLIWQLLTKRPENIMRFLPVKWSATKLPENIWIGTTCENQEEANKRIPYLLEVPAKIRFLSCEPLIGPIDFKIVPGFNRIDLDLSYWWVIVGGESGNAARPMDYAWANSIISQCRNARVPVFFKQWGEFIPSYSAGYHSESLDNWMKSYGEAWVNRSVTLEGGSVMVKVGKKSAGSSFFGKEYKQFPRC